MVVDDYLEDGLEKFDAPFIRTKSGIYDIE